MKIEIDATRPDTRPENRVERPLFQDPSHGIFGKRIIQQFFELLQVSDMTEKERGDVRDLLYVIALKFVSIWTHDQCYDMFEKQLIAAAEANPCDRRENQPLKFKNAQTLYIELDGFLVQCKSVLDHVCIILHYTMNISFSSLSSFGDNGNKIIKILKSNAPSHAKPMAAELVEHIQNNQNWLKLMIDARDRMNHFMHGGIPPIAFGVGCIIEKDGTKTIHRPKLSPEQEVKDTMTTLLYNLLQFIEFFLGAALSVRTPDWAMKWVHTEDPMTQRWNMIHGAVVVEMVRTGQLDPNKVIGGTGRPPWEDST
jgi:hypothetical protein